MNRAALFSEIKQKSSFLCVGLDPDLSKIPKHLLQEKDPIFSFCRAIIEETAEFAVAYKPNIAFFEALGPKGWETLQKVEEIIPREIFTIADAKRGDIGNTSKLYAKAFFEKMNFDSVTVAPYMGADSVTPFLEFEGKWVILLALTSNAGSMDFQLIKDEKGKPFYQSVLEKSQSWGTPENMMYVVGATRGELIAEVRKVVPDNFFLVPGVGAQGGSLEEVAKYGMNATCGLLVNSSRGIIYASGEKDFAKAARMEAQKLQAEMKRLLDIYL
ncbi:orotidine-5'-phosphate decarboxylase [Algoriphagus halophytocola]|uniref:Orotidine 5'-phosphate decarboxylase n=1 Tax=Algoriphagus halophytocola TaxID=2991499 RepID=A0ABY6MEW6_9BACT|nr:MULTISPECIES: orotidine-5'-phosphate decarboxylase [unclassified Algoriphagus]UZD21964.1 orotidine-5'-phosphate decarboxylase [Algoriphagus sp. TR-M5]WBL43215.1 orotidine-5'-phosphate decarboxylase [Algoriphagus sp. TR-M9]